jgi:hypothetical protein
MYAYMYMHMYMHIRRKFICIQIYMYIGKPGPRRRQKRPTYTAKETHIYAKRDPHIRQKRPERVMTTAASPLVAAGPLAPRVWMEGDGRSYEKTCVV